MKPVAYPMVWLSMLLVLVLGCAAGTAQAQSEGRGDHTIPGGQASPMAGQAGMEGMRGGQESMGPMR
jgi:hypothetical protein